MAISGAVFSAGFLHLHARHQSRCGLLLVLAAVVFGLVGCDLSRDRLEAFKLPSASMEDTLRIGDHFMVDKAHYKTHPPARGDIVAFSIPFQPGVTGVKRIIALPGDTVEIDKTTLLLNGKKLDEPYAKYLSGGRSNFGPVTVPTGKVFLLGDNRDQSKDSRHWIDEQGKAEPFLDIASLQGKAFLTYWNSGFDFRNLGRKLD